MLRSNVVAPLHRSGRLLCTRNWSRLQCVLPTTTSRNNARTEQTEPSRTIRQCRNALRWHFQNPSMKLSLLLFLFRLLRALLKRQLSLEALHCGNAKRLVFAWRRPKLASSSTVEPVRTLSAVQLTASRFKRQSRAPTKVKLADIRPGELRALRPTNWHKDPKRSTTIISTGRSRALPTRSDRFCVRANSEWRLALLRKLSDG